MNNIILSVTQENCLLKSSPWFKFVRFPEFPLDCHLNKCHVVTVTCLVATKLVSRSSTNSGNLAIHTITFTGSAYE